MAIKTAQRYGATVYHSGALKTSRHPLDVLADRIRQASVEPTLMGFGQRLIDLLDATPSELRQDAVTRFMTMATSPQAHGVLRWIRENHTLFAVLCASKFEDADTAMEGIEVANVLDIEDAALPRRPYDIAIRAECLTPLAHGSDNKSGNATLFRRMDVLGKNGALMRLPYYAGNAIRGQLRDILADHFSVHLGLANRRDNPPYSLWFFHALYAGGALEEASAATKAINKELGDNGAVRSDGVRTFRDLLPALSLLGCALGNKVLHGHINVGDWRPICKEWGNAEGNGSSASELFEWLFLTRRDDYEGRTDEDKHHGMIAVTETLKPGTLLEGGIDIRLHCTDLQRSALGVALREMAARGRIGAQNRADLGSVRIDISNPPDPEPYETFLRERRKDILDYLNAIGALNADAYAAAAV
jgi:hypothetical protein